MKEKISIDPLLMPAHLVPQWKLAQKKKEEEKMRNLVEQGVEWLKSRALGDWKAEYPDLPVAQKKTEIAEAIQNHQVVIVQAETGSGKTTQIPKICLEAGMGIRGKIGCTQPRRIAALSIADRLREEIGIEDWIAHKIRFIEKSSPESRIKVMTDGILLQELRRDPYLNEYTCIILDEAHERSLNIDILMGMIKRILPKRTDLRLIITSATLDTQHFKGFFPKAKILDCEGRSYPVEIEYWDPEEKFAGTPLEGAGIVDWAAEAIESLWDRKPEPLLCFLPTEKDILDLRDLLEGRLEKRATVLPLYGRMGSGDQKKVFENSPSPKIILSTNIAETSLTLPGIAYVVDTGTARISRYNARQRIQALPVESIAKSNARQRSGRAGRVRAGHCIRLYSKETFEYFPDFPDPEIRRANLANVLLQLLTLKVDPYHFEYLQAPDRKSIKGAMHLLGELGAISSDGEGARLTKLGWEMAKVPMDVSLSRILLEGNERKIVEPLLIVVSALCISDLFIVPAEEPARSEAREKHKKFAGDQSDLLTLLKLWNVLFDLKESGTSQNQIRKWCVNEFISYQRIREWQDLCSQFARMLKIGDWNRAWPVENLDTISLHKSLLVGFPHAIAVKDRETGSYQLAGHRETWIFPASNLFKNRPDWVVACEIRETSKLFLHRVAKIEPEWIEEVLPQFCKKSYGQPQWNPDRGFVEAREMVRYKGLLIHRGRLVNYEAIDAAEAEVIFWEDGVSAGNLKWNPIFIEHNQRVLHNLAKRQKKLRTQGLVPSSVMQGDWYRKKVSGVANLKALKDYLRGKPKDALFFDEKDWLAELPGEEPQLWIPNFKNGDVWKQLYPDRLGRNTKVYYRYDFGDPKDGISVQGEPASWKYKDTNELILELPGWLRWFAKSNLERTRNEVRLALEKQAASWISSFVSKVSKNVESIPVCLYRSWLEVLEGVEGRLTFHKNPDPYLILHLDNREVDPHEGPASFLYKGYVEQKRPPRSLRNEALNVFVLRRHHLWVEFPTDEALQYALAEEGALGFPRVRAEFRDRYYALMHKKIGSLLSVLEGSRAREERVLAFCLSAFEKSKLELDEFFPGARSSKQAGKSIQSLEDLKKFKQGSPILFRRRIALAFEGSMKKHPEILQKMWEVFKGELEGRPHGEWVDALSWLQGEISLEEMDENPETWILWGEVFSAEWEKNVPQRMEEFPKKLKAYFHKKRESYPRAKELKKRIHQQLEDFALTQGDWKEVDELLERYRLERDAGEPVPHYLNLLKAIDELQLEKLFQGIQIRTEVEKEEEQVDKDQLMALRRAMKGLG